MSDSNNSIHWTSKAGAWFSIGASPGALLIGAGMAERHGGAAPVLAIIIGVSLIAAFAYFQGLNGLRPPIGHGQNLTRIAPLYVGSATQFMLGFLLAASMIGWFGFNVGLGGAATAALLNLPDTIGVLMLGLPILLISFGGLARWNWIAILTATASLILIGLVVVELAARTMPVTLNPGSPISLPIDIAAFVGYTAVFSVRAPDLSFGLSTRRDLLYCVLSLCIPVTIAALAGVGLQLGTNSTDLVGVLAGDDGLPIGNLFVAMAVIGPSFTTIYSGSMALNTVIKGKSWMTMIAIAIPGLILAITRFDRQLGPWLALLAATLPPFVFVMALEAALRRNGRPPQQIPIWTWGTGSIIAITMTLMQQPLAILAGLTMTAVATGFWLSRGRRPIFQSE